MGGKFIMVKFLVALFVMLVCLVFDDDAAFAQEIGSQAHVDTRALNLRLAPSVSSSVLRALPFGTPVNILDRSGDWAKVFVQSVDGKVAEGWVAAQFLGQDAERDTTEKRQEYNRHATRTNHSYRPHRQLAPLRVSKLDFDCRPALFGNNGIRKCVASARVQLLEQEFDPDRSDHVFIGCRGEISYRTDTGRGSQRLLALERHSIAHDDRLGQSVRVNFPVSSEQEKIISARLVSFSCRRN